MARNGYNSQELNIPIYQSPELPRERLTVQIPPNSRTIICGKTGSGKTYLAERILKNTKRLVVFDIKNNLAQRMNLQPGSKKNWSHLLRGKNIRIQVKYPPAGTDLTDYYETMCGRILNVGNCVLYIDELYDVIGKLGGEIPYNFRAIYSRGREPIYKEFKGEEKLVGGNIGVIACTQRPSRIPLLVMTEVEQFFIFRLQNPDDRITAAGYTGQIVREPIEEEHGFYYYQSDMEAPVYVPKLED